MSVYTPIERTQLEEFLHQYRVGKLTHFQGITAGIENTNYFVSTTLGEYVLTLFEQYTAPELPFFLEFMAYVAEYEIPSAHPIADNTGNYLSILNGKPAALVKRLKGQAVIHPNPQQCQNIGCILGYMHTISPHFPQRRKNDRGPHWWKATADRVFPHLEKSDAQLLQTELDFQATHRYLDLPRGIIHADLFRDNALFEGNKLSGVIDFYYACHDVLLYDVAVTVNDWCSLENGHLDSVRLQAMLDGYYSQRDFTQLEHQVWPILLRAAALRFWLSRLQDWHFPRPGEITHRKDPHEFRNILQARIHSLP